MAEKVTKMKLKVVDLQCDKCYKKVKKVLCKFPQIQDQEYDRKNNIVTITVVCCNPEKIRDKLCCKGCGIIISVEIVVENPPPGTPPGTPPPPPSPPPRPCCVNTNIVIVETPPPPPPPPVCRCPPAIQLGVCCVLCSEGRPRGPCFPGYYERPCYSSPCGEYFNEENRSGCTIM